MGKIIVNPENLFAGSKEFQKAIIDLQQIPSRLNSTINGLVGANSEQLVSQVNERIAQAQKTASDFQQKLTGIKEFVARKAAAFESVDNENEGAFSPLNTGLLLNLPFLPFLSMFYLLNNDKANNIWTLPGNLRGNLRDWITGLFPTPYQAKGTQNPIPSSASTSTIPTTLPRNTFGIIASPISNSSINYVNWYGNTQFAYENRKDYYESLQGLHSGIDFMCDVGTPITNPISSPGKVISIANTTYDYKAGPHNILVDHGEFLVLYGHTSEASVTLGQEIRPGTIIGKTGEDKFGTAHLHLEVIKKDESWEHLSPEIRSKTRPGSIRTNPVPYLSSETRKLLEEKASKSIFHPLPDGKWSDPNIQPDINPGKDYLVP